MGASRNIRPPSHNEAHMGTPAKQNPILLRCRTDTTVKYLNVHNVVLYNTRRTIILLRLSVQATHGSVQRETTFHA